jgi:hypothetical protein
MKYAKLGPKVNAKRYSIYFSRLCAFSHLHDEMQTQISVHLSGKSLFFGKIALGGSAISGRVFRRFFCLFYKAGIENEAEEILNLLKFPLQLV